MLKVGITGGIGSGKSTVAAVFRVLGIPVFDADSAAKMLMNEDEEIKAAIINEFGNEVYKNGRLDTAWLASRVFHDSQKLEALNAIVHPATIRYGMEWLKNQNAPYIIREAALLFESRAASGLDLIIGVSAPQALRIRRTMERNKISREEVLERMSRQIDETLKMKLCDRIIYNDEQHLVIPQVLQLHEEFKNWELGITS